MTKTRDLADLANGITSANIVDGAVTNADINSSAAVASSKLAFTQSGTGAVQRTAESKLRDVVSVKDFGAVGDGVTNDTTAIQAALNQLAINGGTLLFSPGTYKLETLDASNAHFSLINKENITILGYGATLLSTATTAGTVFLLDGCRNISIDGLTVVGQFARTGSTINTNSAGVFSLRSSSRDSTCISINNVRATSCYFFLEVLGSSPFTYRVIDFSVQNCLLSGGYYGLNFQNNGDNFSASGFRTNAVLRSYFLYGVDGHNVSYISKNGDALTDCLIKAYDRDTTNIRVKARIISNTSIDAKCTLESQHPPATQPTPAKLLNINVDIDDRGSTGSKSVRFAYFQNSSETASAAYVLFDNICISGAVRNSFDVSVVQVPAGKLDISNLDLIDPEIWNNKGFYYLPTEPDSTVDPNKMIRGFQIYAANSSAPNPPVAGRSWAGLSAGSDFSTLQLAQDTASLNLYVRNKIGANSFSSWGLIPDQQSTNWTPSLQFGTVGGNVGMTGTQTGLYVRMGSLVQIWCDINLTNKGTSTGDAFITGLPFNVGGGQFTPINVVFRLGGASLSGPIIGYAEADYIILGQQGAAAMTFLNDTNFTNTSRLWLTCTYRTDSVF
jgi:hypothetical protein